MPEPEIARRCPTCGVSIREAALFCPQCGDGLPQAKTAESQNDSNDEPEHDSEDNSKDAARDAGPASASNLISDTVAIPKTDKAAKASAVETAKAPVAPRVRGAVGTKIQRATTLARDVEGDVKDRARKVRRISNVVLDEAGYDPSLRFVLVAAALFVLFLVIVLLNKVIT